jgi:hypothetical protein
MAALPFSQVHLAQSKHRSTDPLLDIKLNIGDLELTLDSKTDMN